MTTPRFDVIIVGAGPAGVAAAGALAGTGISVCLIEAGAYAGAENWSGCVYFTESLAAPDCFGRAAVESAPFERRVARRGTLMHNGVDAVGLALTDPAAFEHCFTVLRPLYDPYFAGLARSRGAVLLTGVTVTSLIRKGGAVTGVNTGRGPLAAGVVFLAEGDASHLVRSEGLERVAEPHYLQGVKAVLDLPTAEIDARFGLRPGEGAAYELIVRNASLGGRTSRLNLGGFLYTNRDSLSLGFVAPLDNLRKHYRGDHSLLFEWLRGLPLLRDLAGGARLSAYGAKIIRSGGWRERPVLVEDGLAVGGSSAGLGIDLPFPNFTGPAAATGLFFARAVRDLLREGHGLDRRNLRERYLEPLSASVYGRNSRHLSRWPGYFGRSSVLFGRTADLACGTARFLAAGRMSETARFAASQVLSLRGMRELAVDTIAAISALRLGKPLAAAVANPLTWLSWAGNQFRRTPAGDPRLEVVLHLDGKKASLVSLPWPVGPFLGRISPALARAVAAVYANDGRPVQDKFSDAVRILARSPRVTDLFVLPGSLLVLAAAAVATSLWDAFRYYVLRTPAATMLAGPARAYREELRTGRSLDAVRPAASLEAKLALNTYQVGGASHIRTLWPADPAVHPAMTSSGLWQVCPARVYTMDAPLFGRGKVTVNWENCIKCESCWRAEPGHVLWGRFTDHRLIYRPRSASLPLLLDSLRLQAAAGPMTPPSDEDEKLWYTKPDLLDHARSVLAAAAAFLDALDRLPASADAGRLSWPISLGRRLSERLTRFEAALRGESRIDAAGETAGERKDLDRRLAESQLFPARYAAQRTVERLRQWFGDEISAPLSAQQHADHLADEVRLLFPDRVVKEWEEAPLPVEWEKRLRRFIADHQATPLAVVRALASASPALALIASLQLRALRLQEQAGKKSAPGLCAVDGEAVEVHKQGQGLLLRGTLSLVPTTASSGLLIVREGQCHIVPFDAPGATVTPTPAIGFRPAGLAEIVLNCTLGPEQTFSIAAVDPADSSYLAIALGAGDYLSRRSQEHAAGRVQFPGQMLDTGGRDGIAKLGSVKALVARVEAWRMLLETLYDSPSASRIPNSAFSSLCSAASSLAFGPENGCMAYDAGQVFGGFAYSEDDLLSRAYRDSSLFRFLPPGLGSAARLRAAIAAEPLEQAFAAELGSLDSVKGNPLAPLAKAWRLLGRRFAALPAAADEHLAGEAAAVLLGTRALLVRVERMLDAGQAGEAEAAFAEVLLGIASERLLAAELSVRRGTVPPSAVFPLAPAADRVPLDPGYDAFCSRPGLPHRSGLFLLSVFDRSPRYVPEMQLHDEKLRQRWQDLTRWFQEHCSGRTWDGMPFERHVERLHDLPKEIVQAVRDLRWLATYIPVSDDGLGWRKADYFILNSVAATFGDASIPLLIMASTSIGTTPVLLGLEDELPRVREELEPLARDSRHLGEIASRIRRIIATFRNPDPSQIRKEYEALLRLVDHRIRHTRVVKYLAANFLKAFYGAGIAGRRGDFGGFRDGLEKAAELVDRIMPDVLSALEELPRRERSHRLFLRNLGHGGVSAFALTEPTAGSDSGGVRTTAVLRTAMLSPLPDGRYAFSPTGEMDKCRRYLIDADRIVFTAGGMAFRTPDDGVAVIRFDSIDPATGQGVRSYDYRGTACEFHDIGQVRTGGTGARYEYYSVTGAKMWITNGSIATQFSLFAQSAEGVTGFMVDRFAEGLKVGADERKMGQRGSPTNEISLDSVRVPREAVIGYEGHGQVNALETLNAGRCGLAVVAGALGRRAINEARRGLPPSPERDRLLGEAAAIQFGSESLAYYLIGLFDRPHGSVRMESAIAKYVCSEDVHEILSLVERALGPASQTERLLVEKARRDARILNIYEGTNEVQRFLILKDLVSLVKGSPALPSGLAERPGDSKALTLLQWKNRLRSRVAAASALLGDAAWSDAMLQPALFPLAAMAGEVLRLECTWYRMEWLDAMRDRLGEAYVDPLKAAGTRAAERALSRLDQLDRTAAAAWEDIRSGRGSAEVRAADALLDRAAAHIPEADVRTGAPHGVQRILCILRPVAELSPEPRLSSGALEELVWTIDPLDSAALAQARALKGNGAKIIVDVLMPGPAEHEQLLRQTGAGADRLVRLATHPDDIPAIARAVQDLDARLRYDLIMLGSATRSGDRSFAQYLAGVLGRPCRTAGDGTGLDTVPLPSVLAFAGRSPKELPNASELAAAAVQPISIIAPPAGPMREADAFSLAGSRAAVRPAATSVREAAELIMFFASDIQASRAEPYAGPVGKVSLTRERAAWTLIDGSGPAAERAALRAARAAADAFGCASLVLIAAPRQDWPMLLGLSRVEGVDRAFCVDTGSEALSDGGRLAMLRLLGRDAGAALFVAGPAWDGAMGSAAGAMLASTDRSARVLSGITELRRRGDGSLIIGMPCYDGKLLRKVSIDNGELFATMAAEADLPATSARPGFSAAVLEVALSPDWLITRPAAGPPTLMQAEVIIDVGYGIRGREGLALAQELKKKLEALGFAPMLGATRKVTQDLKLLPLDRQIGQTGVRVNPKLVIALGISGAPQHVDWIGTRAEILCFNKDAEAPLMKLNQTRPAPRVHPVPGDLFETVRELIGKLG